MSPPDLVLMGRAAGAFGLKGEVKLTSFATDDAIFQRAGVIYLGPDPERARPLKLLSMRPHGGRILLRLAEIKNREEAAALGGAWAYLRREYLAPLAEDEYYWFQLKGASVITVEGRQLGRVHAVVDYGAHDLLVVRDAAGGEWMIPVTQDVVQTMDLEAGEIVVEPTPGLLEAQGWEQDEAGG